MIRSQNQPAPRSGRSALRNPWLLGATAVWIAATLYLLLAADLSVLPAASQEPLGNTFAQLGVLVLLLVLVALARRAGIAPIDHTSDLGIGRRAALLETAWLLVYMVVVSAVGWALGIHSHLHLAGLVDGSAAATVAGLGTASSLLLWAGFNTVVFVLLPLFVFLRLRGYSARSLLLGFPAPRTMVPFAAVAGVLGLLPFVTAETLAAPWWAHLLTLALYAFGTILPVAIFIQALVAPRLAILARSWLTGAVLAGVVYAAFNLNEYFTAFGSPAEIGLSLATLAAGDLFWGVAKGASTLLVGSAWMHVFTTHTLHFADGGSVARIFGAR